MVRLDGAVFPVFDHERDALVRHEFDGSEPAGMDRVEFENSGAGEDAVWVAADVPDTDLAAFEESDSEYLGYRSYILPRDWLNRLSWRELPPAEVERRVNP